MVGKRKVINETECLVLAVFFMLLVILAIAFIPAASDIQKVVLGIGTFGLFVVAYLDNQKVLMALQALATVSVVVSAFGILAVYAPYLIAISSLALIIYLFATGNYAKDHYDIIGTVGFVSLAFGLALNSSSTLTVSNLMLAAAGMVIATYAAIEFLKFGVKIQAVWVVLNILFMISPIVHLLT